MIISNKLTKILCSKIPLVVLSHLNNISKNFLITSESVLRLNPNRWYVNIILHSDRFRLIKKDQTFRRFNHKFTVFKIVENDLNMTKQHLKKHTELNLNKLTSTTVARRWIDSTGSANLAIPQMWKDCFLTPKKLAAFDELHSKEAKTKMLSIKWNQWLLPRSK